MLPGEKSTDSSIESSVDVDKPSVERVHLITKEVLKACNVIRPTLMNLNQLPGARKQAKASQREKLSKSLMKMKQPARLVEAKDTRN